MRSDREEAARNYHRPLVNLQRAKHGGAIATFTFVCGTMALHKPGAPEVHFYTPEVHDMCVALRLLNLHLRSALMQLHFSFIFTSREK